MKRPVALALTLLLFCGLLALPQREAAGLPMENLLAWPNDNPKMSGCFVDDMRGYDHLAMDISGGKQIKACEKGTVVVSTEDPYWGNTILIRHDDIRVDGNYLFTEYAHLSKRYVEKGESVYRGQRIGVMGMTGQNIKTVHLHLAVKVSDRYAYDSIEKDCCVDPALYLDVPDNVEKGFSQYSTCCDAYYTGLVSTEERGGMLTLRNGEALAAFSTYQQGHRLKAELSGTVVSNASVRVGGRTRSRWITYVRVTLTSKAGQVIYSHASYPNRTSFDLSTLKLSAVVKTLEPGFYKLTVFARDEAGNQGTVVDQGLTVYGVETEIKNHESSDEPLSDREKEQLNSVAAMAAVLPPFTNSVTLTKSQMLSTLSVNFWEDGLSAIGVLSDGETGSLSAVSAASLIQALLGVPLPEYEEAYTDGQTGVTCRDGVYTVPRKAYAIYPYLIGTETLRGGAVKASYLLLTEKERNTVPSQARLKTPDLVFTCARGGPYFGFTILSLETNLSELSEGGVS